MWGLITFVCKVHHFVSSLWPIPPNHLMASFPGSLHCVAHWFQGYIQRSNVFFFLFKKVLEDCLPAFARY